MTKIDQATYDAAVSFNRSQLTSGKLTAEHVTSMAFEWQAHHGLLVDGKAGTLTIESIESVTNEALHADAPEHPPTGGVPSNFYDRRATASKSQDHGSRSMASVTGICLHQTACVLGENPPRWDTVGAHVGVTREGKVIWLHSFDRLVWHGNGWNNGTVGIEIDGLYAGIEGDPSTVWNDPTTPQREQANVLTPATIEAVKQTIRWIASQLPTPRALVAHRQSSGSRRNDPGSAIWKEIALPMSAELGMNDGGAGFKLDDGYPIPVEWDPARVGYKY